MDGWAWWATVHGVTKSRTRLSDFTMTTVLQVICFISLWAQLLQPCLTLCDPMDYSPPGSSVYGILQARILEWVAMPSPMESSQPRDWTHVSMSPALAVRFFTTSATRDTQVHYSYDNVLYVIKHPLSLYIVAWIVCMILSVISIISRLKNSSRFCHRRMVRLVRSCQTTFLLCPVKPLPYRSLKIKPFENFSTC